MVLAVASSAGMVGTASEGGPICAVPAASALSGIGLWRRPGVGVRGKGWAGGRAVEGE